MINMGIKRAVSPFSEILSGYLPSTAIITRSPSSVIYAELLKTCKEHKWGATVDKANGVVTVFMKVVDFLSVVEIRVSALGRKLFLVEICKQDQVGMDGEDHD